MADKPKYTVVGEYVTVKTNTSNGPQVVGLYAGSPWPDDATEDATQHHLDNGLITETGKAPKVAAPAAVLEPEPAAQVPDEPVGEPGGPKPRTAPAAKAGPSQHEGGGKKP